jgi:molybdate transport system substrate-binding protein
MEQDRPCLPRRKRHGSHRAVLGVALGFGLALVALKPAPAAARDLVVYAEPTLKPAMRQIGQLWKARTGVRVNVFVARGELSLAQIERGARCDVIVGIAGDTMEDAKNDKLIKAATSTPVFRNSLVLVGRDGSAPTTTDVATALAGKKLAIADPERDLAGSYGLAALDKAGIKIDPESDSIAVAENSIGVLRMLVDNKAQVGLVYATDAAQRPAFKVVQPLEPASHPGIAYVAAEAVNAQSDTRPFLQFLKSDEARGTLAAAGLLPVDD